MPGSLVDAESLLSVDVGTITTRASLFDVVEGHYRFVASGNAPTTISAPLRDISEGVRLAIEYLQTVTGRIFLGPKFQLIMPTQEGRGVDTFAATISAGPAIKTAVVGLLDDVSLQSTLRLARSLYTNVVETIGLNDTRKPEEQIDSLLRLQPDLILIAGGTDGGATRSVQRLIETVGLACYLLPMDKHPALLYAGNQELADEIKTNLTPLTSALSISPNLRPGIEVEDLRPAQSALAELYSHVRQSQINGVEVLNTWTGNTLMPTTTAEGRIIRFLSQVYDSSKGILGVDIGASSTTIAAAFGGELSLGVYAQLGLGECIANLLHNTQLEEILKWIPLDVTAERLQEYIFQKSIYPASIPATPEDLVIEQALARVCISVAMNNANKDFPRKIRRAGLNLTPYFEPILAAGSVITRAPSLGQSLMILLDAIQPLGITNFILDQNNLLPALGAAASRNSILPIQILESGAFLGLATVVVPYVNTRSALPILRARLVFQNGNESQIEVKQGTLEIIQLPIGQSGRLYLEPLHHADLGFGVSQAPKQGIPVTGTALGVVFDGRGRPLRLPVDATRRREILKKWLWALGG
jgi:uncharacterized protein (TIGR01319 family)